MENAWRRISWLRRLSWSLAGLASLGALLISSAAAATGASTRLVRFHGFALTVPAGWPVFNLAKHPSECVRFNRHAVYLGRPGANQSCPTQAAGRTEAILVEPLNGSSVGSGGARAALPSVSVAGADPALGTMAQVVDRAAGVLITATWNRNPPEIARMLRLRSPARAAAASRRQPQTAWLAMTSRADRRSGTGGGAITGHHARHRTHPSRKTRTAQQSPPAGHVYTGRGFDVCSTPSSSRMSAWSSYYHAVGVYIGGTNMACSQPNLTSSWVSQEASAGWHLIPIYVGLQAPKNDCGCASMSPGSATTQGQAAANDAVAQARSIGLGSGNPIYYDMEGYNTTSTNTSAVLAFLSAWTKQLHAAGYKSGVYSSDSSGIHDLVSKYGTGFAEPDELWMANWNGQANTRDANVPSNEWADHQRLHQYQSDTESHGGVRMNIDRDWVDAATAEPGSSGGPPAAYWLFTTVGNVYTSTGATFYGSPVSGGAREQSISGMAATQDRRGYWLTDARGRVFHYGDAASRSMTPALPPTTAVAGIVGTHSGSYWLYTRYGSVYTSTGASWYGSPAHQHAHEQSITGMSATMDGRGYWLVDASGRVFHYGDAGSRSMSPALPHVRSITGIVAAPGGGYWLFTRYGKVYTSSGTSWYGSPAAQHAHEQSITGMIATPDGKGYWLVDASGRVYHYGDAAGLQIVPGMSHAHPVKGIAR